MMRFAKQLPRAVLLAGSALSLSGCIAAAALPIVAGSGALVRNGVSDDAVSSNRAPEGRVAMRSVPVPTPTPPPPPTAPALAEASTDPDIAALAAPTPAPTPAPALQDEFEQPAFRSPAEPVIVMTLPALAAAEPPVEPEVEATPPAASAETAAASLAALDLPPEPVAAESAPEQSEAVDLADFEIFAEPVSLDAEPEAEAPAEAQLAAIDLPPEPVAAETTPTPTPAPSAVELAPVELPAEPVAAAPEPEPEPASPAFAAAEPPAAGPADSSYAMLRSYALRALGGGLPLPSAQLADPTSLQPVRRVCEGSAPTIVFDLDPEDGLVPLVGPLAVNTDLARVLADLRSRGVAVAWLTDRTPIDARAVRDRLVAANLDPDAEDAIYVERYPGETKQARRDAIAQTSCVIAMAGDTRSDFDDLYNYIIDESDARALEPMLGNGWFLIRNPVGE